MGLNSLVRTKKSVEIFSSVLNVTVFYLIDFIALFFTVNMVENVNFIQSHHHHDHHPNER